MSWDETYSEKELLGAKRSNPCTLTLSLLKLQRQTKYPLVQKNGQRRFGPPPDWSGPKPKGNEIYIGGIPRDIYEDELVPLCSQYGKIYEFRLMLDFSGFNRGFAFVTFCYRHSVGVAIRSLHGFNIRTDCAISVYPSVDNCTLFITGIPYDKTHTEVQQVLNQFLSGIKEIKMYPNLRKPSLNRGYIFVEFVTHSDAMVARKLMWPSRLVLWNRPVRAEWAIPRSKNRYNTDMLISNLSSLTTENDLHHVFFCKGMDIWIVKVQMINNIAFIKFRNKLQSERAYYLLKDIVLHGNKWDIKWSHRRLPLQIVNRRADASRACTSNAYGRRRSRYPENGDGVEITNSRANVRAKQQPFLTTSTNVEANTSRANSNKVNFAADATDNNRRHANIPV